ncbi:MAG: DUF4446 family protein [Candidatus Curtissbacteria bacterium]|nr:DUF4446 family protein [Candidatus Curtissbacteria bacterium]
MESLQISNFILIGLGIWIALLNIYLFKIMSAYKRLTRGANNQNLSQVLESLISKVQIEEKRLFEIAKEVNKIEEKNKSNFQKYALIRYNPFEDSGGDQSFIAAFLDGNNNGIVLSSLHSRGGTRVYAKQVIEGKATSHQFSKEEKEVVEKATANK